MLPTEQFREQEQATVATIKAMRRQEELSYTCRNCYEELQQQQIASASSKRASPVSNNDDDDDDDDDADVVTIQTRTILCDWSSKIVDFCDLDQETVEIAMSYVDRFVQTERGFHILHQSNKYQLLVVTALYVAIKVHETVAISTIQFEKISRGMFTADDVEVMERVLLAGLNWHLHPPTSICFVRLFLDLIPARDMTEDMQDTAFILAKVQTELAVRDCALVPANASTIAFASLMNAFEAIGMTESVLGSHAVNAFASMATSLSLINKAVLYDAPHLLHPIQARLYQAIAKQSDSSLFVTGSSSSSSLAAPSTPPRKGVRKSKSCETTPRSVIGRTA